MVDEGRPEWVDDELFPFENRFVSVDSPGFGLSSARPGYTFERLVLANTWAWPQSGDWWFAPASDLRERLTETCG